MTTENMTATGMPVSGTPAENVPHLLDVGWVPGDDGMWRIDKEKYAAYLASLPEPELGACPAWCRDHSEWNAGIGHPDAGTHRHTGPQVAVNLGDSQVRVEAYWFDSPGQPLNDDALTPIEIVGADDVRMSPAKAREIAAALNRLADEVDAAG